MQLSAKTEDLRQK